MPRGLRAVTASAAAALVALLVLVMLVAGSTLAPHAYADDPPIETESPGGATCLPGGPTEGCAPDQTDRPSTKPKKHKSPSATPTRSASPSERATPTRTTAKPERTRTAKPTVSAAATSSPASSVPAPPPTTAAATPRSTAAPAPAEAPQASAVAVQSALPEDGAPGWVGPVATALLVLLVGVLVAGPLRRRFGASGTSDGGPPAAT